MQRLSQLTTAAIGDALGRTRTWMVAGWTTFFVFAAARVIVPARSDGSAGLSVFGAELLHALGRSPGAPAASLPVAILAALLISLPVAGFALAHGPMRAHLGDRRLRILTLRAPRAQVWWGRVLGDGVVLGGIALSAALLAIWNGEVRATTLSMEHTLAPGIGHALLATLYGAVFVLAGHLVAVARQRPAWLGAVVLLLAFLGTGAAVLAPIGGLLSGQLGASVAIVAAGCALGGLGQALFRRSAL